MDEIARLMLAHGIDSRAVPMTAPMMQWWIKIPIPQRWRNRARTVENMYQFIVESIFPEEFP